MLRAGPIQLDFSKTGFRGVSSFSKTGGVSAAVHTVVLLIV